MSFEASDEPTAALDPTATGSIEELLTGLKNSITILVVTHSLQQAARVSDLTAYMYLGEMIEFGATEQMFIKPLRKQTEECITVRFGRFACDVTWKTGTGGPV